MAAAAGIFNHALTAGQALTGKAVTPRESSAAGTSSTSGSSSSSATISANDFLTLLVTEMQNQDPTANTDPNEYINQLVQVNSLEQLININQTLSADVGSTSTSTGTGASTQLAQATPGVTGANLTGADGAGASVATHRAQAPVTPQSEVATGSATTTQRLAALRAPGNLSVPGTNAAAQRVAHALDGPTRPITGSVSATQ